MKAHRILFLYSELADYFLSCAEELRKETTIDALKIIHWDVNEEAPFNFDEYSSLDLQAKTTYSNQTDLSKRSEILVRHASLFRLDGCRLHVRGEKVRA